MRLAAIDVGTNTAMLLVAEIGAGSALVPLHETQRFIRLGEGVDAARRVTAAAMLRLRAALLEYQDIAREYDVEAVVVGATSASRDAKNQVELIDFVRRETGLHYEILSGEEEAALSFRGALSAIDDLDGPCAVIDVGGGSTEIVVGQAGGGITARHSLDVGSVRLTERFFADQPPSPEAVARAEAFITRALDDAALPLDASTPLIAAAETPLLVALLDRGVSSWGELSGAAVTLPAGVVHRWRARLLALPYDAVLAIDPTLMTGRADVAPAAVLLFDTVLRYFGLAQCRVSPRSLRHGLALHYAARMHIARRAFEVFKEDLAAPPPMTLRGADHKRYAMAPDENAVYKAARRLLAEEYAGTLSSDQAIDWAVLALEAGYDTPHLCMLASFEKPANWFEVKRYFRAALEETGVPILPADALLRQRMVDIAQDIVEQAVSPWEGCRMMCDLIFASDYPRPMQAWMFIYDGVDPETYRMLKDHQINDAVMKEARLLAEGYDQYAEEKARQHAELASANAANYSFSDIGAALKRWWRTVFGR